MSLVLCTSRLSRPLPILCVWLVSILLVLNSTQRGVNAATYVQNGLKLVGTGAVGVSRQGVSVAINDDANTLLVGGPQDDDYAGAAWVFERDPADGSWIQQGSKLKGNDGVGQQGFGTAVALSDNGNMAIIGGPRDNSNIGAAWVFVRSSGSLWTQQGPKLMGSTASGDARQGYSVALSGDGSTALVGGPGDDVYKGATWVFVRVGNTWTEQAKLVGTGGGRRQQGSSAVLSGDGSAAVVGGFTDDNDQGAIWIFARTGNVWTQQGTKLTGTGRLPPRTRMGLSVSMSTDGRVVLAGGPLDDVYTGAAWVFTRNDSGLWSQQGDKLVGFGAIGNAKQGASVSLTGDGKIAVVGGNIDDDYKGAIWVYARNNTNETFVQIGVTYKGSGAVGKAQQGVSIAHSRTSKTFVVGGYADNDKIGAVWVFDDPSEIRTRAPSSASEPPTVTPTRSGTRVDCASQAMSLIVLFTTVLLLMLSE